MTAVNDWTFPGDEPEPFEMIYSPDESLDEEEGKDPACARGASPAVRSLRVECDFAQALVQATTDSERAEVLCDRAMFRKRLRDLKGALADLTKALSLDPANPVALVLRGEVYLALGRHRHGFKDFTRCLEHDPRLVRALSGSAQARFRLGDLQGASDDCTQLIELAPTNPVGYVIRGTALADQGDVKAAILDYDLVVRLNASDARGWKGRGILLMKGLEPDLAGARRDLTRAVELDPGLTEAWVCLLEVELMELGAVEAIPLPTT